VGSAQCAPKGRHDVHLPQRKTKAVTYLIFIFIFIFYRFS
jgi:hypothetical protein